VRLSTPEGAQSHQRVGLACGAVGGHVLGFRGARLTLGWQRLEQLIVALPDAGDFLTTDLRADRQDAIDQAECARPE